MQKSIFGDALFALVVTSAATSAPAAFAQPAEPPAPPASPTMGAGPAAAAPASTATAPAPEYSNMKNEWAPGDPVPPGYRPDTEVFVPLVLAGSIQLGTSWLTLGVLPGSILIAAGAGDSICDDCTAAGVTLLIPGIGPFITMGVLAGYGDAAAAGYALLAVDGLIQGAGLGMLIAGLVMEKDVLVRDRGYGTEVELKPVIAAGPGGGTVGLGGSF
jgi:hypothetical protein